MSDSREVEQLYRTYGPLVLRRARSILGDAHAAKDATQEVFVRVINARHNYRGEASIATWLYQITTNYCLNQIRDAARRSDLLKARRPQTEGGEGEAETRVSLAQVLRHVPDELAEIAVYYFVDQMNQDEIAELLGVSRRTVGNRLDEFRRVAREATEAQRS